MDKICNSCPYKDKCEYTTLTPDLRGESCQYYSLSERVYNTLEEKKEKYNLNNNSFVMEFDPSMYKEFYTAKIKKLRPDAQIPTKGSQMAAGYDLYAAIDGSVIIAPGETISIGTGLAIEPPPGRFGAIFARSGWATKRGLRPANCVGVCDEDYRGEYIVAIHNDSQNDQIIHPGDRIAQLVFLPYFSLDFEVVDTLDNTERGNGGFGSTGN